MDCLHEIIKILTPFKTLFSVILGSVLTFLGNYFFYTRKKDEEEKERVRKKEKESEAEKNRQHSKLNAALAALEDTRFTVLSFKAQFVNRYNDDSDQVAKVYNESKITSDNKDLLEFWYSPENIKSFFETCPPVIINNFPYGKELDFVALNYSPYLVTFYKLLGELDAIKHSINERNDFWKIMRNSELKNKNFWKLDNIILAIAQHDSAAKNLTTLTNSTLALIVICKSHLNDYAAKFLPAKELSNFQLKTNYEQDMPSREYHKDFENMIKEALTSSNTPLTQGIP